MATEYNYSKKSSKSSKSNQFIFPLIYKVNQDIEDRSACKTYNETNYANTSHKKCEIDDRLCLIFSHMLSIPIYSYDSAVYDSNDDFNIGLDLVPMTLIMPDRSEDIYLKNKFIMDRIKYFRNKDLPNIKKNFKEQTSVNYKLKFDVYINGELVKYYNTNKNLRIYRLFNFSKNLTKDGEELRKIKNENIDKEKKSKDEDYIAIKKKMERFIAEKNKLKPILPKKKSVNTSITDKKGLKNLEEFIKNKNFLNLSASTYSAQNRARVINIYNIFKSYNAIIDGLSLFGGNTRSDYTFKRNLKKVISDLNNRGIYRPKILVIIRGKLPKCEPNRFNIIEKDIPDPEDELNMLKNNIETASYNEDISKKQIESELYSGLYSEFLEVDINILYIHTSLIVDKEDLSSIPHCIKSFKNHKGGRKKKNKKIRKHKGIIQTGGNKGKLKKGYRYSGKRTKKGLPIIIKSKN